MLKYIASVLTLLLIALPTSAQQPATGSTATVQVSDARLAAQVGSDMLPIVPTDLFKPTDTIYLSVSTITSGATEIPGSIGVAWLYMGGIAPQAVHNDGKELVFSGSEVTVFQMSKPDDWPDGEYSVQIFLNGSMVRQLTYKVR
jgi:hypothetical protein